MENIHGGIGGCPDGGIGGAEEKEAARAGCGSEVGNAAVVAEEKRSSCQDSSQSAEREIFEEDDVFRKCLAKGGQLCGIAFAADHNEAFGSFREAGEKFGPSGERPVFAG